MTLPGLVVRSPGGRLSTRCPNCERPYGTALHHAHHSARSHLRRILERHARRFHPGSDPAVLAAYGLERSQEVRGQ